MSWSTDEQAQRGGVDLQAETSSRIRPDASYRFEGEIRLREKTDVRARQHGSARRFHHTSGEGFFTSVLQNSLYRQLVHRTPPERWIRRLVYGTRPGRMLSERQLPQV